MHIPAVLLLPMVCSQWYSHNHLQCSKKLTACQGNMPIALKRIFAMTQEKKLINKIFVSNCIALVVSSAFPEGHEMPAS